MRLPDAPNTYDRSVEDERNRQLEKALRLVHRRDRDVEIGAGRLILKSPDGARWEVTVDNTGTLSATSL